MTDHAWAAGFFDGEGSTVANPRWRLSATQKDPEVLYKMQRTFGGHVYVTRRAPRLYCWNLNQVSLIIGALGAMWPHLGRLKQAQALAAAERSPVIRRPS